MLIHSVIGRFRQVSRCLRVTRCPHLCEGRSSIPESRFRWDSSSEGDLYKKKIQKRYNYLTLSRFIPDSKIKLGVGERHEATKMASRTYTPEQVALWEDYVSLPRRFQLHTSPKLNLEYLTVLHTHQIARIPYENLLLHYSATYRVSLNPQDLFQKIVGDARGRGGYCMEGSIFFNSILRSLGFRVEMRGVRIRPRAG